MTDSMRALLLDRPGNPASLRVGLAPVPEAGEGQVLIRVEACGLNPVDVGLLSRADPAWQWPHIGGLDVAGTVVAVGSGVRSVSAGQRVAVHRDLRRQGGLAQFAVADAIAVAAIPNDVDVVSAAALPCAGMTAFQAVNDRLRVSAQHTVLVTGANGGVGGFAVQLAARTGARVIATAARRHHERVLSLGAHEVIDHHTEDVLARSLALTNRRGVDRIVDTVSAASAGEKLSLLAYAGGIACVAGRAPDGSVEPFTTAPSVHEIALGAAYGHGDDRDRARLASTLGALLALVETGDIDPMVAAVVSLDRAAGALTDIAEGRANGKLVVRL